MAEFKVIQEFFLGELMPDYVALGPGDDCAVLSVPTGYELCVSTDTLLESVHFPSSAAPEVIASRSITANLSDLAAMGAKPHAMTLALTIPSNDQDWLETFSNECKRLAGFYQCPIVGGNLAKGLCSITLTVMGIVPIGKSITRSGAQVGDSIYVTGELGGAAGAVAQLGLSAPSAELLAYYEYPKPRIQFGQGLMELATSAIDLSDGLLADLGHILTMSHRGAELDLEAMPVAPALKTNFDEQRALDFCLNGGDDYELCFTANPKHHDEIVRLSSELEIPVTRIGVITDQAGSLVNLQDERLVARGYEHFKAEVSYE